jgi:hypothetical protein
MAASQHKTCLAVLRGILGPAAGQEKRFAALIGKSVSWVKKASSGLIPLTQDVILRIHFETGAPIDWLTINDPSAPPVNPMGKAYTRPDYDKRRAELAKDFSQSPTPRGGAIIASLIYDLLQVNASALENNRGRLLALKFDDFLIEAQREFGKVHFRKVPKARKQARLILSYLGRLLKDPPEIIRHTPSRWDTSVPQELFSADVAFIRHGQSIRRETLEDDEAPERVPPEQRVPKGRKPGVSAAPKEKPSKPAEKPQKPSRKPRKKG